MEEKNQVINAKMFGGFEISYNGKSFSIERNTVTKVNQLIQMLMYYRGGIERNKIIENLFGGDVIADPSNSLRALVFRVRRTLPKYDIPASEDYIVIKRGMYSWSQAFEIRCDASEFEKYYKEAIEAENDKGKRLEYFEKAFEIYEGDFLPELGGEEWAITIQVRMRKIFNQIARELCDTYTKSGDFNKVYELATKAARIYPYDDWQYYQMKALIEGGNPQEAMRLYEDTEAEMYASLGVSVSPRMSSMLDRLADITNSTDRIGKVQQNLESEMGDIEGAFCCAYPVFVETYRYIKRVIRRSGQAAWLMLCTLTDGKGVALEQSDRLNTLTEELAEAIRVSARGGDMFARYSNNQFVVLLLGISQEDCSIVEARINENMSKESRKRYIKYTIAPVNLASAGTDFDTAELQDIVRGK